MRAEDLPTGGNPLVAAVNENICFQHPPRDVAHAVYGPEAAVVLAAIA